MIVHPVVLVSSSSIQLMPESSDLIKAMDDAIRGDLQSFGDSFFLQALVSSAIVVIGVAFEGPELLHELWPKTYSFFAKRWVKKIGLIGWLLVVLGVGGEVIFGLLENKAQGLLQTFNDILLADAQRQSSDANERAANASERAGRAQASLALAEQHSAEANAKAEGYRLDIAKANERAARLEVEALKLQGQLLAQGPRENLLIGEKRQKLVELLKPFAGQKIDVRYSASVIEVNGKVVMSTPIGDDGKGLARSLISVLNEAGWNVPANPLLSSFQARGLRVEALNSSSIKTQRAAKALADALRETTLMVDGPFGVDNARAKRVGTEIISPPFDENTIVLTVFTHP